MDSEHTRIGFISTRLAGTDGVSLETAKWVQVLNGFGHECFYFAGESDWPAERSYLVPEAHFNHPLIRELNNDLFDNTTRSPKTSMAVQQLKDHLKVHLHGFLRRFNPQLLVVENALSIPMNVPLGLALTELIAETGLPTIGHHHDFAWERTCYALSAADDYLRAAFPPVLPSMHHVVINSFAAHQLALRTSASSTLIPNVMDFDTPPPPPDAYAADLRQTLGLAADERLLLQPTRIVPRKGIERAIELARRLDMKCALVISHGARDEAYAYLHYLRQYAQLLNVRVIFAAEHVGYQRGQTAEGRKRYALADLYQHADLVTYPSLVEGFGNAFLETIYYRRPLVMSAYEIFITDIQPKGFRVIIFDEFLDQSTVDQVRTVLLNPALATEMGQVNYDLGCRYFSYRTLEKRLVALLDECLGG